MKKGGLFGVDRRREHHGREEGLDQAGHVPVVLVLARRYQRGHRLGALFACGLGLERQSWLRGRGGALDGRRCRSWRERISMLHLFSAGSS